MLFFILTLAFSSTFGIDYGSENIKVCMALPGKSVHIVLNQESKRISPSYFAFWKTLDPNAPHPSRHCNINELDNYSWSYLYSAKMHTNRFPKNGVKGMSHLLDNTNGLLMREVVALMLKHLISTVDEGKWEPETSKVVLTIEPSFPFEERVALLEAAKIANISLIGIIDSPTAVAIAYALEKQQLYKDKEKIVIFIDLGANHTWASCFKFSKNKDKPIFEQLSLASNYSLGGSLMDQKIYGLMIKKFFEKNKVEIKTDRQKLRFLEEAKRAKEMLSLNERVEIKIDDVVNDLGISYTLTRSEFNILNNDFNQSIVNLINEVVGKANLELDKIDSIELLGGTSRVPLVKEILMKITGMKKLNRTMNSDEAMALGSTYFGVSSSMSLQLKKIKFNPIIGINISIVKPSGEIQGLFSENSRVNDIASVSCKVSELGTFSIITGKNHFVLFNFTIIPNENSFQNDKVKITIGLTKYLIPTVFVAKTNDKIPAKIKKIMPKWCLNNEELYQSYLFVNKMEDIMKKRHKYQQVKSDFESLIYKIQNKVEDDKDFLKVLSNKEKIDIQKELNNNKKWIDESENPSLKEINFKFIRLKNLFKEPKIRLEQLKKRKLLLEKLNKTLSAISRALSSPNLRKQIPEKKIDSILKFYNLTQKWFNEKMALINKDYDNPIATDYEIELKISEIQRLYNQYFSKFQLTTDSKYDIDYNDKFEDVGGNFNNRKGKKIDL